MLTHKSVHRLVLNRFAEPPHYRFWSSSSVHLVYSTPIQLHPLYNKRLVSIFTKYCLVANCSQKEISGSIGPRKKFQSHVSRDQCRSRSKQDNHVLLPATAKACFPQTPMESGLLVFFITRSTLRQYTVAGFCKTLLRFIIRPTSSHTLFKTYIHQQSISSNIGMGISMGPSLISQHNGRLRTLHNANFHMILFWICQHLMHLTSKHLKNY